MKKFFKEFKQFIMRGNVLDLAVGVVVGSAFTAIVNTVVGKILTPFINWIIYMCCGQNPDVFSGLDVILIPATLDEEGNIVKAATVLGFSDLITAILNFILVAFVLFLIVRAFNKAHNAAHAKEIAKKKEEEAKKLAEAQAKAKEPAPLTADQQLLTEIRDLLKNQNK